MIFKKIAKISCLIIGIVMITIGAFADQSMQKYATDEFIVKFNTKASEQIKKQSKGLMASSDGYQASDDPISAHLAALGKKYNVKRTFPILKKRVQKKFHVSTNQIKKEAVISNSSALDDIYVVKVAQGVDILDAIDAYKKSPVVDYAEPNYRIHAAMVPNDPAYPDNLWGLEKINCEQAWDISTGAGVLVAVIDSGIDYNHNDLSPNMWINESEIPDNGIDDDGNGYVDDYLGWDFAYDDKDPMDGDSHGTHCAGTIAAVGNNSIGVIGVAPNAKLMAVKALDDSGDGYTSDAVDAIYYAVDNGADVLSCSWGSEGTSTTLTLAFDYAESHGVVSVVAAGNENSDVSSYVPGSIDSVLTVTATDSSDIKAYFSNYGDGCDVAAPGLNIYSTVPGNSYGYKSGTSMACPHVSGLAALLVPLGYSVNDIKNKIKNDADAFNPEPSLYIGAGRINAYQTVSRAEAIIGLDIPYGQTSPLLNESFTYTINEAQSNLMHALEYRLDFGDGSYSPWSTILSVDKTWDTLGSFEVRVEARCQAHPEITAVSDALSVEVIEQEVITKPNLLQGEQAPGLDTSYTYTITPTTSNSSHTLEYRINWGDGTYSAWSTDLTVDKIWTEVNIFEVTVEVRCQLHPLIQAVSDPLNVNAAEELTKPEKPSGEVHPVPGVSYTYTTSGAVSNSGHPVEYRFDWRDGTCSEWSTTPSAQKVWDSEGYFYVYAEARCQLHPTLTTKSTFGLSVKPGEYIAMDVAPSGETAPLVEGEYVYTASEGTSNMGHGLEYRFVFGDGTTTEWSTEMTTTKVWTSSGSYSVKVEARCQLHPDIIGTSPSRYVSVEAVIKNVGISTISELQDMQLNLNSHYYLTCDIDASETVDWNNGDGFMPVGTDRNPFKGSFDGNGYTISYLTVNQPDLEAGGLFGAISKATISHVTLLYPSIIASANVGALVGRINSEGRIENVIVAGGDIECLDWPNYAGGLIGYIYLSSPNYKGIVLNSQVKNSEIRGTYRVGGLVGAGRGIISGCSVDSSRVVSESSTSTVCGGLLGSGDSIRITNSWVNNVELLCKYSSGGFIGNLFSDGDIANCYVTNTCLSVPGTYNSIGGFIGAIYDSSVRNCYADVSIDIVSSGSSYPGGFSGKNTYSSNNSVYENCFWNAERMAILNTWDVGGTVTSDVGDILGIVTADMKDRQTFDAWNFGMHWTMPGTKPQLQVEYAAKGDFNGDGKDDVLWHNKTTGDLYVRLNNDTQDQLVQFVDTGFIVRPIRDVNNDGKDDIVMQDQTTKDVYLWLMDGTTILEENWLNSFLDSEVDKDRISAFDWINPYYVLTKNTQTNVISVLVEEMTAQTQVSIPLTILSDTASQMMISESADFSDTDWQRYSEYSFYTLSAGVGTKTLYVKIKTNDGEESDMPIVTIDVICSDPSALS